jgi:hypothetical protein
MHWNAHTMSDIRCSRAGDRQAARTSLLLAAQPPAARPEHRLGAVAQSLQCNADMGQPHSALDGQRDGARTAMVQSDAEVSLQVGDALADGNLCQPGLFGRL